MSNIPRPSVQQLYALANRVQALRDDPGQPPLTVDELCGIGWALGAATACVLMPPAASARAREEPPSGTGER